MGLLTRRSDRKEYLDDPGTVEEEILRQTYRQMNRVDECTLGNWPILSAVKYFLLKAARDKDISLLDVGCGDGRTLRRIDQYAKSRHWSLSLTGIDLSHEAIRAASDRTSSENISYIQGDVFEDSTSGYDIIISSLTVHHLTTDAIVKLMRLMTARARAGWFISDLNRSAAAYCFINSFVRLGGFNQLIIHDAPLSVARGFRKEDWKNYLTLAELDLTRVKVSWYPNFRYGIRYEK